MAVSGAAKRSAPPARSGLRAVDYPVHVHDIHATILALMGLDHQKLTYLFQGRDYRLTDVAGSTGTATPNLRA